MTPTNAIATCERPLSFRPAAGGRIVSGRRASLCYESFTLKALRSGGSPRIFARVMTGRKPTSRTAIRGVLSARAQAHPNNFAPRQLSAQNVLSLTSDIRNQTSDI